MGENWKRIHGEFRWSLDVPSTEFSFHEDVERRHRVRGLKIKIEPVISADLDFKSSRLFIENRQLLITPQRNVSVHMKNSMTNRGIVERTSSTNYFPCSTIIKKLNITIKCVAKINEIIQSSSCTSYILRTMSRLERLLYFPWYILGARRLYRVSWFAVIFIEKKFSAYTPREKNFFEQKMYFFEIVQTKRLL